MINISYNDNPFHLSYDIGRWNGGVIFGYRRNSKKL